MKIFKHLRSEWFRYGFETLAVVVGILIAFALDNWNDLRQQQELELRTLVELRNALQSDLEDIVHNSNRHKNAQNSCEILIGHMESKLPYHDSLAKHFGYMSDMTVFVPHIGPYETLKTKGLDLISNDSIRLHLSEYYEEDIKLALTVEGINLSVIPDIRQRHYQHFDDWTFLGPAIPHNYELLSEDREFLSYLKHTASARNYESRMFSLRLDPSCRNLINDIEKEIDKRSR